MRTGYRRRLKRDPFEYLEDLRRRTATGVIRLPWGGWCVSDPDLANELLRSPEFNTGTSGFFGDLLPTRTAQVAIGQAARNLLRTRVSEYRDALVGALADLPPASGWPAAGAELVYRGLANVLLHPRTSAGTRRLMDQALHGGVMFRSPHVWRRARAEILRGKLIAAVAEEVGWRRAGPAGQSRDVLDAVLGACPDVLADRTVAEVFLVLFRSIVAPVGSTLAWSVLLACLHHTSDSPWPWPPAWIVREAMRHRPMVWMVGRTVIRPAEFGGLPFEPGDVLSVSPFLVHHDQRRWADADVFRPERWAEPGERGPYVPFGAGPYSCVGASVALTLMTETLAALTRDARLTVTGADARPAMAEGAVPRPFTVLRTLT
ncbi:cytochrome P450 [Amycolatopsis sp. lyj-346]|uniref:cytochrome P450 n=1 Tax=Amycolatopsis sp. lyj-346 TaxID=2789289 RepID=UPI00397E6B53